MVRVFIYFMVVFILTGCMGTEPNVTYEKYEKSNKKIVFEKRTQKSDIVVKSTGKIKGYITKLFYNASKDVWQYEIKSKDASNHKLLYASCTYYKKMAKKGDFIYAVVTNGELKELFLIKKGNYKQKKPRYVKKSRKVNNKTIYKRTKKRQVLGVPVSESILLN